MKRGQSTLLLFCAFSLFIPGKATRDPFYELGRLTHLENNANLNTEAIDTILRVLGERIESLKSCFTREKLEDLIPPDGDISPDGFANISSALISFVMRNCSDTAVPATSQAHDIVNRLREIEYEAKEEIDMCFNAFTLQENSDYSSRIHETIILHMYEGQCILPEKSYFVSEYQEYFKNDNGDITTESFRSLLTKLRIGGADDHAGHDHSEDGHDDHGDHDDHEGHDGHGDHDEHDDDADHDDHADHGDHDEHDEDADHADHADHDEHDEDADHEDHEDHDGHGDRDDHADHGDHDGHDEDADHGDHDEHDDDADHDDHAENGDHDDHTSHGNETDHSDDHEDNTGHDEHDDHDDHDDEHDDHGSSRRRRSAHDSHDHDEIHSKRCYTAEQLLDIFEIEDTITEEEALEMCPALVHQLVSGACETDGHDRHRSSRPAWYTEAKVYGYSTASVAIISFLALVGILVFPVLKSKPYKVIMQFFVALGISTMASDALLHIIPQVLGVHDHDAHAHDEEGHEEDYSFVWKMSVVAGGLYIFFLFGNALKLCKKLFAGQKNKANEVYVNAVGLEEEGGKNGSDTAVTSFSNIAIDSDGEKKMRMTPSDSSSEDLTDSGTIVCFNFTTTLIMVYVGDILHNFADGVAIGVSFASSWTTGIGTSIAVLCHELPHEFGDFAIYLKNGASKWQALGLNFTAACFAFIGLYSGIAMGNDEAVRTWLMSAVAGMFLYIALVQVMNEMVREETAYPAMQFLCQNLGLLLGWALLVVIALYEDRLQTTFD